MPLPFSFDFKKPDYIQILDWRIERLRRIRQDPSVLPGLFAYYKENPAQFIIDWGTTLDPRNAKRGLPTRMPFLLFPKQEELVNWIMETWQMEEPGVVEKSRETGISWVTIALSCTLCLFMQGVSVGFGSRKEEYVDKLGDPKCLLQKARYFLSGLPPEFKRGWDLNKHAPHMRIQFPQTDSIISGEAGDGIGRGDRTSLYFVDEAAWLPRPELVEASLSETTNCRIDVSTVHGMDNPFARKRWSGTVRVFIMDWRDDPRKDQKWYDRKVRLINNPLVVAQELDRNYLASVAGVVIPSSWIYAAIDADIVLGVKPTGSKHVTFDVADEGADQNCVCNGHGILIKDMKAWSGKGDDIFGSTKRVVSLAAKWGCTKVYYDADGLGAGVKGDAREINLKREEKGLPKIKFFPFRGSSSVIDPEEEAFPVDDFDDDDDDENLQGKKNKDAFPNLKSQGWFALRKRFQNTYRAVKEGAPYKPDSIISISSKFPEHQKLVQELAQITYKENEIGKMIINKKPEGTASPNHADAVMMYFAPKKSQLVGFFDVD